MTLHEQYKEDTEPHPFLKNKRHVKILMKKAYLNSIDCMIAMFKKEITIWKKEKIQFSDEYPKVIMIVYKTEISSLSEQRDLIANEL
jgi:hypothetical protein